MITPETSKYLQQIGLSPKRHKEISHQHSCDGIVFPRSTLAARCYDGYYPYAYNDDYYDDGGCYVVRRRVHTRYGWRVRRVEVCG
jgi:hypothetical protein